MYNIDNIFIVRHKSETKTKRFEAAAQMGSFESCHDWIGFGNGQRLNIPFDCGCTYAVSQTEMV